MTDRLLPALSTLLRCRQRIWSNRLRARQVALLLLGLILTASPCLAEYTYRTKDDAIDVILPDGWRVDDSGIRSTLAIFYPNPASATSDVSAITLSSRRLLDTTIERATVEQSVEQFRKRISAESLQVLEEKRTRAGGEAAHEFRIVRAQDGAREIVLITLFRNREYTFVLGAPNEQELNARAPAFEGIISRLHWHRPERVYRSADDALTLEVPLQWIVLESYAGKDRFVLIGPADRGLANIVAVSRWDRGGRTLADFVGQYLRDSENTTRMQLGEIEDQGKNKRYALFAQIGDPPASQTQRRIYDRDAYVLEFRLDGFDVGERDTPVGLSPPQVADPRNVRVMQIFVAVDDFVYLFNFNSFEESYQLYLPVVEDMLQSVRWR